MLDVIEGGARFRYRLVGTAIGSAVGDYSGRYVDEALPPPQYEVYRQKYLRIVHEFAILYEVTRIIWHDSPEVLFRRLMLPLSDDQAAATILFRVGYYAYPGRLRPQAH